MTETMTDQDVFDKVALHLLRQNEKSERNGSCVYRSVSGLKCAVGCLIEDAEYSDAFEGGTVIPDLGSNACPTASRSSFLITSFLRARRLPLQLLRKLQELHDHIDPVDWVGELKQVALAHRLSTAVVDNFLLSEEYRYD